MFTQAQRSAQISYMWTSVGIINLFESAEWTIPKWTTHCGQM